MHMHGAIDIYTHTHGSWRIVANIDMYYANFLIFFIKSEKKVFIIHIWRDVDWKFTFRFLYSNFLRVDIYIFFNDLTHIVGNVIPQTRSERIRKLRLRNFL